MPPPTLQVTLHPDAQAELERRYHTTRDAPTRTRYQMVLLNAQGHTPPQIARLVRCHPRWARRGAAPAHPGQPPHYPPGWEAELVRARRVSARRGVRLSHSQTRQAAGLCGL